MDETSTAGTLNQEYVNSRSAFKGEGRRTKNTPWERNAQGPRPALPRLLEEAGTHDLPEISKEGRALVPGCGRGFDVLLFAQHGFKATGLEVSPAAVDAANEWLDAQQGGALRDPKPDVQLANFFEFEQPAEGYSVIYDYTFLCALPPSLRSDWARKMTDLAAPNGTLITLRLPLDGPERTGGPPYSLWDGLYHDLLDKDWEMVYQRDVTREESRLPSPEGVFKPGREKIAVWRRRSQE